MKVHILKNSKRIVNGITAVLFLLLLSALTSVSAYQVGDTFRDCATCPEMVVLPAGKFTMGSPEGERGRDDDEGPQHQVTISKPFAVGKYEVTVGQYAARAGTTTPYHFGRMILGNQANYGINNGGTLAVGSFPANAFGLHDMHGNVWEWVEDCWHDDYTGAPTNGNAWLSGCKQNYEGKYNRVLRGGSWAREPEYLRSANRDRISATGRSSDFGFRVARTLTP